MLISGYNSGNLNLPRKFTAMVDSEKGTDVSVLDSTAAISRGSIRNLDKIGATPKVGLPFSQKSEEMTGQK